MATPQLLEFLNNNCCYRNESIFCEWLEPDLTLSSKKNHCCLIDETGYLCINCKNNIHLVRLSRRVVIEKLSGLVENLNEINLVLNSVQ